MDICPDFFKNFSLTNLNDLALHVTQNSVIIALCSLHTFIFRDSWQKMWGGVGGGQYTWISPDTGRARGKVNKIGTLFNKASTVLILKVMCSITWFVF